MKKNLLLSITALSVAVSCTSKAPQETPAASIERKPDQIGRSFEAFGYRVPLHNFEEVPADEPETIQGVNEIMTRFFQKMYPPGKPATDAATGLVTKGTRRGVHPRGIGCVQGRFQMRRDLPKSVGIFRPGAEYPVTLRFSNGNPHLNPNDATTDTRGFAMKVHNVPGPHLLGPRMVASSEGMSQDFTLNSTEPFFADNAKNYREFMRILSFEAKDLEDAGFRFIKYLAFSGQPFLAARVTKAFLKIQKHKATNPLGIEYFSITPFQHGRGPAASVAKYKVAPCGGMWQETVDPKQPFFLRANMIRYLKHQDACFKFMIQVRDDNSHIEDPSYAWPESEVRYEEWGRVILPRQDLMNEQVCENLVINPWNTIEEHKPLGGINRIRLPVYLMSVERRKQSNMEAQK